MASSSFRLLTFVCLSVIAAQASPLVDRQAPQLQYNPSDVYDVSFDISTGGGCGGPYQTKIRRGYNDAIDMLLAAIQTIDDLEKPMPAKSDKAALNEWKRKAQTFETMFGAQIQVTQGLDRFAMTVRRDFEKIRDEHIGRDKSKGTQYILKCTDSWLTYLRPNDQDPTNLFAKVQDNDEVKALDGRGPSDGAYFAASRPGQRAWFWFTNTKPGQAHPICDDDAANHDSLAATDVDLQLVTICQYQFDQSSWSAADIQIRPSSLLKKGTHIEDIAFTIGQTWLHEMFHLAKNLRDQKAVDSKGRPIIDKNGRQETAYGWANSASLARADQYASRRNPDNYAYFAAAMYWSQYSWATGEAKKISSK